MHVGINKNFWKMKVDFSSPKNKLNEWGKFYYALQAIFMDGLKSVFFVGIHIYTHAHTQTNANLNL